ncbi:unnamed protein product [Hymenolepis diminuta]|uniref:Hydrolase_4 domain-containing protein n=1 Tax=Hymenolepis diminuta TaxID=6216 RepID=A0A0R3SCR8_HYMDI|nr:unnamed protein product [Hymenolepis diminuta]
METGELRDFVDTELPISSSLSKSGTGNSRHVVDLKYSIIQEYTISFLRAMRVVLILRHLLQHIFSSLGIAYDSEANFQRANCPILILHSADDRIVPIQLGKTVISIPSSSAHQSLFLQVVLNFPP